MEDAVSSWKITFWIWILDFSAYLLTYDVIGVTAKSGDLRWTGRLHLQNVPDIFVGSFERAESDRNPEQSLPAPDIARRYKDFSHLKVKSCQKFWVLTDLAMKSYRPGFAAVHRHADLLLHVDLEQILERVVVLVQPGLADRYDEVEEGLQAGFLSRRIVLNSEDFESN